MMRGLRYLALTCVLSLVITPAFAGKTATGKPQHEPSKAATVRDKAQLAFQRDLVSVLAPRADALPLLGAALLARPLFNQPPSNSFHALIGRAAQAEGADAAVSWARLADCDAKADACPNTSALDQLLIAAFYARKNTLIPNIVAVVSILFYVVVAVPFHTSIGMPALAFGDTAKNTSHALILFVLLTLAIGNLGMRDLLGGVGRILIAGAAMWLACWGVLMALPEAGPGAQLLLAGAVGTVVYFGIVLVLRVEEVHLMAEIVRRKLGR